MNKPKAIGTAAETAVVKAMRLRGFPTVERRALRGTFDAGDITGVPGIVVEVKGGAAAKDASDGQIAEWLTETRRECENAEADMGLLVVQRRGIGPNNAHMWWAILDGPLVNDTLPPGSPVRLFLGDVLWWLRAQGYGTPLEQTA